MDKRITDILNDLYAIDPQFKAHEKELRTLVSQLVLSKPDTHFDESFAAKLRAELLETKVKPMPSPYTSFFMSRMFYGIVGSALTILVVVPFTFVATQKATSPDKPVVLNPFSDQVKDVSTGLSPQQQISNKGMNAFGKLALLPTADAGTSVSPQAATKSMNTMSGTATLAPTKIPAAQTTATSITYNGDKVALSDTQGKVFKRTKGADSGKQLLDMVQKGKFGLTDLNSFSDLKLKDVQLSQDKPFGYIVGINLDEGAITITPQWQYWNQGTTTPANSIATLDEKTLISISDDFMKSHSISMNVYGMPTAIADSSTVIYPLKIEDKTVSEETGMPFGLVVTIDPAQKKVTGITNLTSQTYESSQYNLETNFDVLIHAATSSLAREVKSGTATLGTPKPVLMHYWLYDGSNVGNELFIPALSFPVSYTSKKATGSGTIVVPLVKDFLSKVSANASASSSKSE